MKTNEHSHGIVEEFDEDIFDIEDNEDIETADDSDDTGNLTIISALDFVQRHARKSKLSKDFWAQCEKHFDYLVGRLGLNKNQILIIAILCETGSNMSWRSLAEFLNVSRLQAMTFTEDVDDLKRKRMVFPGTAFERHGRFDGIRLAPKTIMAFRHDRPFEPENLRGLSEQMFVDRLVKYFLRECNDNDIMVEDKHMWLMSFVEDNKHLPLCTKVLELHEDYSRIVLLGVVMDHALYGDTGTAGLNIDSMEDWFDPGFDFDNMADSLRRGSHELFHAKLIEHGCDDGMVDTDRFVLTAYASASLLANYVPKKRNNGKASDRDLIAVSNIKNKLMFYNNSEQTQIDRLRTLLSPEGLEKVQTRLAEVGMRKGITCLFYGAPGTGKTETVYQLARATGRDVMQISIAGIRDKFVGESEKNIKGVFTRYKLLCESNSTMPILFINEADALINSRIERTQSSVEKMDNAIQNILLQEMESFDGILIATTNLTGTIDKAFDRRFLFKVEFDKPGIEIKKQIWHSMMPELPEDACQSLANEFDFFGGQIENIARKSKIEYILSGREISLEVVRGFCHQEYLNRSARPRMGF